MEKMEKPYLEIDENNIDIQEKYFHWLDKVITAITFLRYEKNKKHSIFTSSAELYDKISIAFLEYKKYGKKNKINDLITKICLATNRPDKESYYQNKIEEIYLYYHYYGEIPKQITAPVFNDVLNKQQDNWCKKEKRRIIDELRNTLDITPKKKEQWIRSKKLEKMRELLKAGNYEALNLTPEDISRIIEEVNDNIKNMSYFRKNKLKPPLDIVFEIGYSFFTSGINDEILSSNNDVIPEKIMKQIVNQFYKKMLPTLEKIEVTNQNDRKTVAYDYNHLVIASNALYQKNLEYIKEGGISRELLQSKENRTLLLLLPLVGLIDDFSITEMEQILKQSPQIFARLRERNKISKIGIEEILNQFHEVLCLAKVYAETTPRITKILGEETVAKILNNDTLYLSRNPKDFLPYYKEMLKRTETKIPVIAGKYQDYTFESGKMNDISRIMIGSDCLHSCIGPNGAGSEAFLECLTGENADVLLIKDEEGNFVARSLIFRKGNYIVMSSIKGVRGIRKQFYNPEFLSLIAKDILDQAKAKEDRIDYVFLTDEYNVNLKDYPLIMKSDIIEGLPHVDWKASCFLIGGEKQKVILQDSDFGAYYPQTREPIRSKEEITKEELEKIQALAIEMGNDEALHDEMIEKVELESYEEIYLGQDWYLGLKKDGTIAHLMLPTNDKRQSQEIEMAKVILNLENEKQMDTEEFVKLKK